jgi:hypothetical protein
MAAPVAEAQTLMTEFGRARRSRWLLLALLAAGATPLVSSMARASEVPPLLPGRIASVAGTHISCKAFTDSVTCKKTKGLTATILSTGVVRVARDFRRLTSTRTAKVLHNYDGFNLIGTKGVGVYCHVYVAGKPTMSCSLDDPSLVPNSQGFDMTDSSVVVFRYDSARARHIVKTIQQP